ncbi:MAG TPA: sigma-70 family RNA polymerase sigma factor [Polyangiaceae bacterium]|nr:sigma-70 family RNA polymerase sigma factor [Polyangiaceae bacterium]
MTLNLPIAAPIGDATVDSRERLERAIKNDYRLIWRLLRRLGVPAGAADDAAQEVFLVLAERLPDIRENAERSFAFGTAIRVAHSARRRHARERVVTEQEGEVVVHSPLPGPDELSDQKRARELLNRVLDAMPFDLRTVFILFELEGLRSPEIAELVGVPLGTVASRLRRARESFRALVAEHTPALSLRGEEP